MRRMMAVLLTLVIAKLFGCGLTFGTSTDEPAGASVLLGGDASPQGRAVLLLAGSHDLCSGSSRPGDGSMLPAAWDFIADIEKLHGELLVVAACLSKDRGIVRASAFVGVNETAEVDVEAGRFPEFLKDLVAMRGSSRLLGSMDQVRPEARRGTGKALAQPADLLVVAHSFGAGLVADSLLAEPSLLANLKYLATLDWISPSGCPTARLAVLSTPQQPLPAACQAFPDDHEAVELLRGFQTNWINIFQSDPGSLHSAASDDAFRNFSLDISRLPSEGRLLPDARPRSAHLRLRDDGRAWILIREQFRVLASSSQ